MWQNTMNVNYEKKTAIFYFIAAAICYVSSIIWFCSFNAGLGAMWLCIGSSDLCLGVLWMKRSRNAYDQNKKENNESVQ